MCVCVSHSVGFDSLQPYALWPTRLLCPWNSLDKNTGVGSLPLLQGIFLTQGLNLGLLHCAKSLQSCPTLCNPRDGSPPGFPIPGILQARTLEWVAISFSSAWKWKVKAKSLSHLWLSNLMDCSPPGSSVHGIFQAKVVEWGRQILYHLSHQGSPCVFLMYQQSHQPEGQVKREGDHSHES